MALTFKQQQVVDQMRSMTDCEFASYEFIELVQSIMSARQRSWFDSSEYQQLQQTKSSQREQRAEREAEAALIRADWARRNIEPGMVIKVRGTRDGHGMRQVLRVENHSIVCIQLDIVHRGYQSDDVFEVLWSDQRKSRVAPGAQITTHGYDKPMYYGVVDPANTNSKSYIMQKVPNV